MARIPATSLVVLLAAILTALGEVQRPTQGHQLGFGPGSGRDIIFPVSIAQCEPVVIFYNSTDRGSLLFSTPIDGISILYLYFPAGVGYLDWICNIPAGYSFTVNNLRYQYYTVQPGSSSSACLGDLSTTYSYAHYYTTPFHFYTQHSPSVDPSFSALEQRPTIDFPTSLFSTVTANPNLAVTSTITTSAVSSPLAVAPTTTTTAASSPSSSFTTSSSVSPHKSNIPVIAGGVIGGITFILLTIMITFVFRRKRRNSFSDSLSEFATPYVTSQLGSTSPPLLPSSDSTDAMRRRGKFNIRRMFIPDTLRRNHVPTHKSRNPGADSALAFDVTRLTVGQRQALMASLNGSANPATPPAPADAIQTLTEPLESSVHEAAQEEFPEIANVLGVVSQLDPETRNALVESLNNLLMVNPATPDDLTSLPPYAE